MKMKDWDKPLINLTRFIRKVQIPNKSIWRVQFGWVKSCHLRLKKCVRVLNSYLWSIINGCNKIRRILKLLVSGSSKLSNKQDSISTRKQSQSWKVLFSIWKMQLNCRRKTAICLGIIHLKSQIITIGTLNYHPPICTPNILKPKTFKSS